jgi:galactokinase/mevalonate kinase-like predicted kinase
LLSAGDLLLWWFGDNYTAIRSFSGNISDMSDAHHFDLLLSLPPNMCRRLTECEPEVAERAFATFDPPGGQLGSGGGTAYVLEQAWRAAGPLSFQEWLNASGKLIIHGGGESRRLPPYAPAGKLFIPIPVFRWATGQRLDQTLLSLAEPNLQRLAGAAGSNARVMVASGDVFVRLPENLPPIPDADVVFFGLWTTPEEAADFGVMFTEPHAPDSLVTFLQKPTPDEIREKSRNHAFLIDVGIWLLSERAVDCLMAKCGWEAKTGGFHRSFPDNYDLYGSWALHLGSKPLAYDKDLSGLTTAVVPVNDAGFYHFGTCCDMVDSVYQIQNIVSDQTKLGSVATMAQPRQFLQNTIFEAPLRREENHSLWAENSHIPNSWTLASRNILTGVPDNDWPLVLEDGICLDFVPLENKLTSLRTYGFNDSFRGVLEHPETQWLERPFVDWLDARGLNFDEAGLDPKSDIQTAPLFPALNDYEAVFVTWMFAADPESAAGDQHSHWRTLWLDSPRFSARDLAHQADLAVVYRMRAKRREDILPVMAGHAEYSVFSKLDLESTAELYARSGHPLPPPLDPNSLRNPLMALHERMFRSAVLRLQNDTAAADADEAESQAFSILHDLIVEPLKKIPVRPRHTLLDDQIVWGRSPVRLDMAGGWSDTPPYCLERGGAVLNIAVDLNGQPPIQVFSRRTPERKLSVRSIDLGVAETLITYDDIADYRGLGSSFALARGAFALAGFHPDFNGAAHRTLADQLEAMGGGVEISMVAAIPKGSGLGTSSILAAAILGVLSDLAGLGWSKTDISRRTLALEQMLSSGGGWQDQVGGLFPGIKLISTQPGLSQNPELRWLPGTFFDGPESGRMMLYYTGITRVAQDILGEIVRGIFLNSKSRLETVDDIAANARFCHDAVQRGNFEDFVESVKRSWMLNRRLDSGTNPPGVQAILDRISADMAAAKLPGAGGGGYLFIVAKDIEAARRIRSNLESDPPNPGARFVEMTLSKTGLQVTRS